MSGDETIHDIASGLCDDGMTPYVPGVNCMDCGKFVGRDGSIEVSHREMSSIIASVEGTCGPCEAKAPRLCPSTLHDEAGSIPVATVPGTFDCSTLNGKPPERIVYCDRCAQGLGMAGYFTPDPTE